MHIAEGVADPFQSAMLHLYYVLKGIKRSQAEQGRGSWVQLPTCMTPELAKAEGSAAEQVGSVGHSTDLGSVLPMLF